MMTGIPRNPGMYLCGARFVYSTTYCLTILIITMHCQVNQAKKSINQKTERPNFVIFLVDDVGWGDLASYGHPTQEVNAVDRMAAEGMRFTQWYSAASVCTPSRAALLTGRQPFRTGLGTSETLVLLPGHNSGLPHEEVTIAEALGEVGYTSGIVGKWHLGINAAQFDDGYFLPHTQGFNYVGTILPFTLVWACDNIQRHLAKPSRSRCFLYRNSSIVEQPINLEQLTSTLVQDAKAFLYDNANRKFFLYVSLPQCHTPMFSNRHFSQSSQRGVYGDQINEMSWAIGEIQNVLRELNLEENTLSLFLSDNGPHRELCEEGGHPGPFREGKCHFMEGGLRVPAIARWPGTIRPGVISSSVISSLDIFPTLVELGGAQLPTDRIIDGRSFAQLLLQGRHPEKTNITTSGPVLHSPPPQNFSQLPTVLYFYCDRHIKAVRYGPYKIYLYESKYPSAEIRARLCKGSFPLVNGMENECPTKPLTPWHVYNVEYDPSEQWMLSGTDQSDVISDVIKTVAALVVDQEKKTALDSRESVLRKSNVFRSLTPCCNPPYCSCNYRSR